MATTDNLLGLKDVETGGSYGVYVNLTGREDINPLSGQIDLELKGLTLINISGEKQDAISLVGQSYYVNLSGSIGKNVLIRASSNFILASDDYVKASDG